MLWQLRHAWQRRQLREPAYAYLWDAPPPDEWVSIDCETTGLDKLHDRVISIGAVRIHGHTVLTSQRLEIMLKPDMTAGPMEASNVRIHRLRSSDLAQHGIGALEAARQVLDFVGARPLVGYFLEFDIAMLNRLVKPLLGVGLPQKQIEISSLYYDIKHRQYPGAHIDLRLEALMQDLELPQRHAHEAFNDATMVALAFIKLRTMASG